MEDPLKLSSTLLIFLSLAVQNTELSGIASCPRDKSRVVAKVVREKVLPAFHEIHVEPSDSCPISLIRDMYAFHEDNKFMDTPSRWGCNFCGKAFISEHFIDLHFENRHPDQIQTENAVCLADVCDVFRCDIISGASVPDYWDIALCLEDDMQELFGQCEILVDSCIPKGLTHNETITLKNAMMDNVCSFLTCSKFWNNDIQRPDSQFMALYIVLTIMTCFGIVIYNFVFYNYFYSGLVDSYDPTPIVKHKIRPYDGGRRGSPRHHAHASMRREFS